ncbi:MAG: pilus assembly protein [Selenomonadaceae bacterium]|nr:pilus assembly protein [Selenomonadaceae bacterium]
MFVRKFKQRGQAMVMYAFLIPIFFLLIGFVVDFGWYFYKVSRMQNAADAAVIVGAQNLSLSSSSDSTTEITLIQNQFKDDNIEEVTASSKKEEIVNLYKQLESQIYNGNEYAANYAQKNLSDDDDIPSISVDISSETGERYYTLVDGRADNFRSAVLTTKLYQDQTDKNTYYYRVSIEENVGHLFLKGFSSLLPTGAPVASVVKMVVDTQPVTEVVTEEEQEEIEEVFNSNMILGNWEVQNYYRQNADRRALYEQVFGTPFYDRAWNMFSDHYIHYTKGDWFRTETVNIFDDVVISNPDVGTKNMYDSSNVSYGSKGSSVDKTAAACNGIDNTSYTYNVAGNPYSAEDLDSIDIDFEAEMEFNANSPYVTGVDWDLQLGTYEWRDVHASGWTGSTQAKNDGSKYWWVNHMRIHSTLNFDTPYPVRQRAKDSGDDIDVLWVRIESEPMYRYPCSPATPSVNDYRKEVRNYNSVRQLFLNFNEDSTVDDVRPLAIFYDGPERYDTTNDLRASKPVIINLKANTNAILYLPNSPVVFNGNGYDFNGFIVAKSYIRLKTAADFEAELEENPGKYTRKGDDYYSTEEVDNPYYSTTHTGYDANGNLVTYNRDNGEPKKIKYIYKKVKSGGIDVYIDDYGNVQYMDLENPPKNYGKYNTFGRTNFTTHNYEVKKSSAYNLLLSSN